MRRPYRRPELTAYRDPEVGGCASDTVSNAECSCDCATGECDLVNGIFAPCPMDVGSCTKCTDGLSCP